MTPVQILTAARELISEPERWTKGAWARDANGEIPYGNPAVYWCSFGALVRVSESWSFPEAERLLDKAWKKPYINANDHKNTTHNMVLAAFDRAIALASAAQETTAMTPQQRVLAVYPGSRPLMEACGEVVIIAKPVDHGGTITALELGTGHTVEHAWQDAADRLEGK